MKSIFYTILSVAYILPVVLFAQEEGSYSTLINSNLQGGEGGFSGYLNNIYLMAISVAALLAVVKIIIAGVKYMLTDIVTSKEEAKKDIRTSLLGLIIIMSVVLILNVINPNLTSFDLKFKKLNPEEDKSVAGSVESGMQNIDQAFNDFESSKTCATLTDGKLGNSGRTSVKGVNVSNCPSGDQLQILQEFEKICKDTGGIPRIQASTATGGCAIPIEGAQDAREVAESISNQRVLNTPDKIGTEFVSQEGRDVITNVTGVCDKRVSTLPDVQKNSEYEKCILNTKLNVTNVCESVYGKIDPSSNNSAVRCNVPREVKKISALTEALRHTRLQIFQGNTTP